MKQKIKLPITILCLALSACSAITRSKWQETKLDLPKHWQVKNDEQKKLSQQNNKNCWEIFGDKKLNQLIAQALQDNNDLAAAALRVKRAQLQASLTGTNITPDISLGGKAGITRDLRRNINSHNYQANALLNYEIDLWGKLAAARDAAKWEATASSYDLQAARLSLIGTAANLYWKIAFLNQQINSTQANINALTNILKISQVSFQAGKISQLDLIQAEQSLNSQKSALLQTKQNLDEAHHALAILFNHSPQYRLPESDFLSNKPLPAIQAGIPAKILQQRPDVRAAEMRLREALANVDQTRLSFLPSFSLTGSLGGSSIALSNVIHDPIGALGIGLTLPFIQWNTMNLSIKISRNKYAEDVINFRQTLYKSLAEVEDALAANQHYQQQKTYLKQSLEQARQAESIAKTRYLAGKTGMQSYLDQQNTRRSAEIALAQNQLNLLDNRMQLMLALGSTEK